MKALPGVHQIPSSDHQSDHPLDPISHLPSPIGHSLITQSRILIPSHQSSGFLPFLHRFCVFMVSPIHFQTDFLNFLEMKLNTRITSEQFLSSITDTVRDFVNEK
jgi:hypothetical protein